jgi:LCP family protein required for cell wall assembly
MGRKLRVTAVFGGIVVVIFSCVLLARSLLFSSSFITRAFPKNRLLQTDARTNILLLGIDKRAPGQVQSGVLTDTIILASIPHNDGKIALISIPRDLWIEKHRAKINEIYGMLGANDESAGSLKEAVSDVLGVPIHYQAQVGFGGFKEAIDALGGIDIEVKNTFEDYRYPVFGMENANCGLTEEQILEGKDEEYQINEFDYPCRFEHIRFDAGTVSMDGTTALKYARSRHSTNPAEGTDFARAKRQQQVILAVKNKALSLQTVLNPEKIADLYNIYKNYFSSDIFVSDAQALFAITIKTNVSDLKTAVLTNSAVEDDTGSGLLYTPEDKSLYNGKWVVVPKGGSFAGVHAFVQKLLFEN